MNLILDIGNTSTKLAVFEGSTKKYQVRIKDTDCEKPDNEFSGFKPDKAIISSVRKIPPFLSELILAGIPFVHILSNKSELPFKNEYETPETLGPDRIAAVAGAYQLFPGCKILIIDAGSALTFDFLEGEIYRGGNISPGLNMRIKSLNYYTDRLPLVTLSENYTNPGRNTTDAILAGVINGVVYEINEYIRTFVNKNVEFKVVLTGGDSELLKQKMEYRITYMPDIVIDGLNYLLEYNAK